MSAPIVDYCREVETFLCRKNDGHLVRVVGPSFEIVSQWAAQGIPLKIAFAGIDRYFERYYRKGPRRRPIKIDFCEADVLDVFDEWRRALGLAAPDAAASTDEQDPAPAAASSSASLPAHLERVVTRLTTARATGKIDAAFDAVIDRVASELDAARASARGVRGDARQALLARLSVLDKELLQTARAQIDDESRAALVAEADADLASYRDRMSAEAYARARGTAVDRLLRERFGLPIVTL